MGILSSIFKPIKKIFKKVAKVIKKVAKAVWKPIKAVLKPIGKFFNKLGPIGTIALSFLLPGIGGILGSWMSGAGAAFQGMFQAGSFMHNMIGAVGTAIKTAGSFVGGVYNQTVGRVFSTISDGIFKGITHLTGGETGRFGTWLKNFKTNMSNKWGELQEKWSYKGPGVDRGTWFTAQKDVTEIAKASTNDTIRQLSMDEKREFYNSMENYESQITRVGQTDVIGDIQKNIDPFDYGPGTQNYLGGEGGTTWDMTGNKPYGGTNFVEDVKTFGGTGTGTGVQTDESWMSKIISSGQRAVDWVQDVNTPVGTLGEIYDVAEAGVKGKQTIDYLLGNNEPGKPRFQGNTQAISNSLLNSSGVINPDPIALVDTGQLFSGQGIQDISMNYLSQIGLSNMGPDAFGMNLPSVGWGYSPWDMQYRS